MKARDLADLLRIPNVVTAVSDVLAAGVAVGAATSFDASLWARWSATMLASASLYCAGMALNDAADAPRDARERPERPIPSGRVRRAMATALALLLVVAGISFAAVAGHAVAIVALLLASTIVLYDLALSGRPFVGPAGMASCRMLNVLMGCVAFGPLSSSAWVLAGTVGAYVFGVTHLSLGETGHPARRSVGVATATTLLAIVTTVWWGQVQLPNRGVVGWAALAVPLAALAWSSAGPLARAQRDPTAERVGPAVGTLVSNILWLDCALAQTAGHAAWLAPFLALGAVQHVLRRRFRVT